MKRMTLRRSALTGLCVASVLVADAWAEAPEVAAGRRIAERACGECHAIGRSGASPLADAPPFRNLHRQFDVARFPLAFEAGMLVGHPRMPKVELDEDELAYLTAFLVSFSRPASPQCEERSCAP